MPEPKKIDTGKKQLSERKWIEGVLTNAQSRRWYGTIKIELKKGLIDLVYLEETLKPPIDPS